VNGTVSGDRVRLRSSLPYQGTRLAYHFDGTIQAQSMTGELDLGEYGKARWTAHRVESRPV
jgi:D-glucosaminate-6-phosphate ammonia-lyase